MQEKAEECYARTDGPGRLALAVNSDLGVAKSESEGYGNSDLGVAKSESERYGERGIRTPDTAFGPYNDLANRRLQPLGHLSTKVGTARRNYRPSGTKMARSGGFEPPTF